MSVLDEYTRRITFQGALIDEAHVSLLLQPKPRWLPTRIWKLIVARLLVIEEKKT